MARLAVWLGLFSLAFASDSRLAGSTIHVSPYGSHQAPFTEWHTAATNLLAAVALAGDGDSVLLTNGLYFLTNQVTLTNAVLVRSMNGPSVTVVDGMQSNRCFELKHVGLVVEGLTIQNGKAPFGGGVRFGEGGILRQCVVRSNLATLQGGGGVSLRWHGSVEDCQILNNAAPGSDGGGVHCLSGGTIQRCVIAGNTARVGGGAAILFHASLVNCLVVSNNATQGGGVICSQYSRADNCTIAHNTARVAGGLHGFYGGEVLNTILYANTAPVGANYFNLESDVSRTAFFHCCMAPVLGGNGNIGFDPGWSDAAVGDYHLRSDSACLDAGRNEGAPAVDLDNVTRPQDGDGNGVPVVDIGAYEFSP